MKIASIVLVTVLFLSSAGCASYAVKDEQLPDRTFRVVVTGNRWTTTGEVARTAEGRASAICPMGYLTLGRASMDSSGRNYSIHIRCNPRRS